MGILEEVFKTGRTHRIYRVNPNTGKKQYISGGYEEYSTNILKAKKYTKTDAICICRDYPVHRMEPINGDE